MNSVFTADLDARMVVEHVVISEGKMSYVIEREVGEFGCYCKVILKIHCFPTREAAERKLVAALIRQ